MPLNHDNRDDWTACRPGEIVRLAGRLRRRRRVRAIGRAAVLTSLLGVALASGLFLFRDPFAGHAHAHALTCRECRQVAEEYVSGRLDAEKTEQVDRHLADCPSCQDFIANVRGKSNRGAPVDEGAGWNETERPVGRLLPGSGLNRAIASLHRHRSR